MMGAKSGKPQRMVQTITVIRPPPPPPPDQPPPPPPEKVEQTLPQNEPDPSTDKTPDEPQQLGDDAFGLVARKGGADLVGGGGAVFGWYQKKIETAISNRLATDKCLHAKRF